VAVAMEHNIVAVAVLGHKTVAVAVLGHKTVVVAVVTHNIAVVAVPVVKRNIVVAEKVVAEHNSAAMAVAVAAVKHNKVVDVGGAPIELIERELIERELIERELIERNNEVVAAVVVQSDAIVVGGAGDVVVVAEKVDKEKMVLGSVLHSSFVAGLHGIVVDVAAVADVASELFCVEDFAVSCVDPASSWFQ